jgi:hypothetical protein
MPSSLDPIRIMPQPGRDSQPDLGKPGLAPSAVPQKPAARAFASVGRHHPRAGAAGRASGLLNGYPSVYP